MLSFTRHFKDRTDQISLEPESLIVAGWTGRDEAALRHHIEELAAIGVKHWSVQTCRVDGQAQPALPAEELIRMGRQFSAFSLR